MLAPEIDEWTQPELYRSTPSERLLTPEQAVGSLARAAPDFVPGDVIRTRGVYEIYDLEYVKSAYVDPGTGRLNGISDRQSGVMGFIRNLHLCALSCEGYPGYIPFLAKPAPVLGNEELTVGGLILAVVGLILVLLCISGLVIWWPGIRRWRRGFQIRRRKGTYKLNYDLHNVVGIAVLPLAGAAGGDRAGRAGAGQRAARAGGLVRCLFALAAGARASVQLAREVTLQYVLSAVAAAVYLVAAVAWVRGARRVALAAVGFELVGVLSVGALARSMPDETVWSGFGAGYGYVPLVLPLLGLAWLSSR